ncbi:MAG: hypothetical protein RBU29_07635, partial [bacterium]|nr:hypothetical protein [bacterium]
RTEDYSDPFPHFIVEHIFQKVQSFAEFQYSLGEKEIVIQIPMKNEHRESGTSQPGSLPDLDKLSTQYVQWFTEAAARYPFFAKSETDLSSFLDLGDNNDGLTFPLRIRLPKRVYWIEYQPKDRQQGMEQTIEEKKKYTLLAGWDME